MVWAMIHNRTVLWKYHDSDQVSSQKQCEDLLQLAPWFPSFDEWEQKLPHLSDVIPVSLTNFRGEEGHPIVLYPQITDVLEESKDVVRHAWIEDASNERHFSYLKSLPRPYQQMTRDLYSEGKNFLYGMLYTKIFELQIPSQQLVFGQNTSYSATNRVPFSIAVHSRHTVGADDGSYIEAETKCLNKMITHLKDTEQSCKVFVMSDRSKTIDLLIEWLFARNCTTMVANHTMGPKIHDIAEHGPWSGAGFLLDLQLVGAAESGVVGDRHRSSTALVIYQVDYNRRMRACGRAQKTKLHDMPICNLPNKHLSGYNYGPGTPTFRHHSHLALLEPIAVVDTYKKKDLKNYVISRFDFERPSIKTVYDALNSFLLAIMTNRSFVLLDDCVSQCTDDGNALARKAWINDITLPFQKGNIESLGVQRVSFEGDPIDPSILDAAIIELHCQKEHYSQADCLDMLSNATDDSQVAIEQLFARGQRFLYGLLFHELFDIYERIEPPWNESPSASIVLDLESSSFLSADIEACLAPMIPKQGFTSPEPCHLFLLQYGTQRNETEINITNTRCTSSLVELPKSDRLDKNGWRTLDFVSRARTGWVSPEKYKITPSAASLIQERIEFYRFRETWKLGRDPFAIENLTECVY